MLRVERSIFADFFRIVIRLDEIFGRKAAFLFSITLLALIIILVFVPRSSQGVENWLFDIKHQFAMRFRSPDPAFAVVGIDMRTLEDSDHRWPWPRKKIAEMISALSSYEPRALIVDILFQNADTPDGDKALTEAIQASGNCILVTVMEEKNTSHGVSLQNFSSRQDFVASSRGEGFVWGIIDTDGIMRHFRLADDRLMTESCAHVVAKEFFPDAKKHLKAPNKVIPIVFTRRNGGIPLISGKDVLSGSPTVKEFIKNRVIVLGVTAQAAHDVHRTSIGMVSGAEILAASIDTLISDRSGNLQFNNYFYRAGSLTAGIILSFQLIFGFGQIFMVPVIILISLIILLTISEIILLHLPLAPFLLAAFFCAGILFSGRYFDHLFSLQGMKHEAQNAKLVHDQLFPDEELVLGPWRVCGASKSAEELGGDYFDYFLVKQRYIMAFIGDATGHGISAALAVAVTKSAMLAAINRELKPHETVEFINLVLFQAIKKRKYITAALLWLDTETGDYSYYNCGHPYPYLISRDGSISNVKSLGTLLGIRAKYKYREPFVSRLKEGEKLVFYTDGLIESFPGALDKDGFELFQNFLAGRPKLSTKEACHDLIDNHPFFSLDQPQPDDFTVLTIERLMPEDSSPKPPPRGIRQT